MIDTTKLNICKVFKADSRILLLQDGLKWNIVVFRISTTSMTSISDVHRDDTGHVYLAFKEKIGDHQLW